MPYIGRCFYLFMLFHASLMASKIGNLARQNVKDLKALLEFDLPRTPSLVYHQNSSHGPYIIEGSKATVTQPSEQKRKRLDALDSSFSAHAVTLFICCIGTPGNFLTFREAAPRQRYLPLRMYAAICDTFCTFWMNQISQHKLK